MADTYTPNLNLKKPGYDSPADIKDLNDNFDKIDTSIDQLSQQKANQTGWTAGKNVVTDANGNITTEDKPSTGADPLTIYPVGSIYMSVNSTSPASLFGGTWEQLKDRFLLGAGDSYAIGSTGGEATVTIKNSNMPYWALYMGQASTDGEWSVGKWSDYSVKSGDSIPKYYGSDSGGSSSPLNNMPPYLAVYMWKRVS